MMPMILFALMNAPLQNTIDVVDSKDDSTMSFIIVNDTCRVNVLKTEFKDWDKVVTKVEKECGLELSQSRSSQ